MPSSEFEAENYQEALNIARRVASPIVGAQDANDVAHEAIARLIAVDPAPVNWRAWLNLTARNCAKDMVKAAGRDSSDLADPVIAAAADQLVSVELMSTSYGPVLRDQVSRIVNALSERDREVLLASMAGATPTEIAARFGLANAAVASTTLFRIRQKVTRMVPEFRDEILHPRVY